MSFITCFPGIAEGRRLQDLAGILDDLHQVLRYIELVESQIAANAHEIVSWEAATSAAATTYARCFADGVRERLPSDFVREGAPPELHEFHDYVITLRNKHIAHSVSLFEENQLRVQLRLLHGGGAEILDVRVESRKMLGIGTPDIPKFRQLCEWLVLRVSQIYGSEREQVLKHLRSMPIEQILATSQEPPPAFFAPNSHRQSRRQK